MFVQTVSVGHKCLSHEYEGAAINMMRLQITWKKSRPLC